MSHRDSVEVKRKLFSNHFLKRCKMRLLVIVFGLIAFFTQFASITNISPYNLTFKKFLIPSAPKSDHWMAHHKNSFYYRRLQEKTDAFCVFRRHHPFMHHERPFTMIVIIEKILRYHFNLKLNTVKIYKSRKSEM